MAKLGHGERVLLVDDDADLVDLLAHHLKGQDFKVETAYDGVQATAMAKDLRPDIVVLDLHLPAGQGLQVLRWLRGIPETKNLPVIIITGFADKSLEDQARELRIFQVFAKPFKFEDLALAIVMALNPPRA